MSAGRLFRTPIAIGMLSGALAGGVLLLHVWISPTLFGPRYTVWFFYYTVARVLLELTFLFTLPALLVSKRARFLIALQLLLIVFIFLVFIASAYGVPLIVELVGHSEIASTVYNALFILMSGALLGLSNAYVYDHVKLRFAGLKWGVLGSSFRIAAYVAHESLQSSGPEKSALFAMLLAMGLVAQGAIAAVPYERECTVKLNA